MQKPNRTVIAISAAGLLSLVTLGIALGNADPKNVTTGTAAFTNVGIEKPGVWRKITPADLPKPFATESANNRASAIPRPSGTQ